MAVSGRPVKGPAVLSFRTLPADRETVPDATTAHANRAVPADDGSVPGIWAPSRRNGARLRLGDVVVELGFADRETVELVAAQAEAEGRAIGPVLVATGTIDPRQLARALAERNGLDYVDLNVFAADHVAAGLIRTADARRFRAIPIAFHDEGTLLVACAVPENTLGLDEIRLTTGLDVRPAVSPPEHIDALITQLSHVGESVHEVEEDEPEEAPSAVIQPREPANDAPVVELVHSIIADAVERGASDIHFEPRGGDLRVRFRVDGVAFDSTTVPEKRAAAFVSCVKLMAELDIAERRMPQDGRIGLSVDDRYIDLRVATLPVVRGEAVVMRILDEDGVSMDLDALGMADGESGRLRRALQRIHGAVLVTGPTGAGTTTTVYAALNEVNTPARTLVTIEDPVEHVLDGVKQVQVNSRTGLTFAAGLRSMVRADPDVLMVGEIRDPETAQIAIESALTGHLVLSTMHTSDAPMAAARLIDMGIEPFLIASGLECVVAQRLARRLCEECRRPVEITATELERSGLPAEAGGFSAYEPGGCVRCGETGYRGRVGIYEVMALTDEVRSLILRKASTDEVGVAAVAGGMRRLREDGVEKVRAGVTSVAEVLRVLGS
jgi:type IV pilus assembly protein PilB